MLEKLFANLTLILGLVLATWGSVLLGIDALGASEFVEAEDDQAVVSMQTVWLTARVNILWRSVCLALMGFLTIWWMTKNWLIGAFGAVFTFFVWRLAYNMLNKACWAVVKNPPIRYKAGDSLTLYGCLLFPVLMLPWALVSIALFAAWVIVEFGVTLPSFFLGERLIQPRVRYLYRSLAEKTRRERSRGFRETALVGMLYLFGGFVLQIAGTAYLTVSDFQGLRQEATSQAERRESELSAPASPSYRQQKLETSAGAP